MTINKLQVKKLRLKNFRAFDEIEFKFSHINHILGDNGTGKSSIAEGIVFALYGTTIYGSPRMDDLIKIGAETAEAEVTVSVSETVRVIRRTKTAKGSEVFLDGVKTTQKVVQEKVLGRLDAKQFLLGFSPMFYDTLNTSDLREVVTSLIMPPSMKEVLEQLTPEEREILEQVDILSRAELKKELSGLEKKKIGLESQAELLKKHLEQLMQFADAPNGLQDARESLARLRQEKKELEKTLEKPPVLAEIDTSHLEKQLELLRKEYSKIKITFKSGDTCPSCGQTVTSEAVAKLKEVAEARKQEVADRGKSLSAELKAAEEKNAVAKEAYNKELETWKSKREKLSRIASDIETMAEIAAKIESHKKTKTELEAIEKEIGCVQEEILSINRLLGSLSAYELKSNELHAEKVKGHLDRVEIKLFDVVKSTGELVPTFKLLYDGKPQQLLSFSEKIRVGLELGQMFRKLSGFNAPYFLDNAESIGRPPQFDTQSFQAWFVLGSKLEVRDPDANKITAGDEAAAEDISPENKMAS